LLRPQDFWTHLRKCCKSWQSCCSRESFGIRKGNRSTRTREGESFGIRKETEEQEQEKERELQNRKGNRRTRTREETIEEKNNDNKRANIDPKSSKRRCRSSRKKNPTNKTLSCKPWGTYIHTNIHTRNCSTGKRDEKSEKKKKNKTQATPELLTCSVTAELRGACCQENMHNLVADYVLPRSIGDELDIVGDRQDVVGGAGVVQWFAPPSLTGEETIQQEWETLQGEEAYEVSVMNNNSTDLYSFYIDMYSCVHQKLLIHMYVYIAMELATTTCVLDHDVHTLFGSSPPKKMQSQFVNISDIMSKSFAARKAASKFFSDIHSCLWNVFILWKKALWAVMIERTNTYYNSKRRRGLVPFFFFFFFTGESLLSSRRRSYYYYRIKTQTIPMRPYFLTGRRTPHPHHLLLLVLLPSSSDAVFWVQNWGFNRRKNPKKLSSSQQKHIMLFKNTTIRRKSPSLIWEANTQPDAREQIISLHRPVAAASSRPILQPQRSGIA
jgi:hypothetical protein